MIATRFRSVYWVGGVAVAALGCYLVSQRVAAERATLTRTEASIVAGKRDIRALETEIGTRAGLNQIERWNAEVLSLAAPKASQFVASEIQLAALVQPAQPAMQAPAIIQASAIAPAPAAPQVTTVAYAPAPAAMAVVVKPAAPKPAAPRLAAAEAPAVRHVPRLAAKADVKLAAADVPVARTAASRLAGDDVPAPRAAPHVTRASFVPAARPAGVRLASDDEDDDRPRVRQAVYARPGRDRQNVALLDGKLLVDLDRMAESERAGGKRNR